MFLLFIWISSAAASVILFAIFSLVIDGRVFFSSWVNPALGIMALLGPLGTLLTLVFLVNTAVAVCGEISRQPKENKSVLPIRFSIFGGADAVNQEIQEGNGRCSRNGLADGFYYRQDMFKMAGERDMAGAFRPRANADGRVSLR